ncbi:MAG: hypothetical protein ACI4WS_05965 [Oscillospiraceae bacterium]
MSKFDYEPFTGDYPLAISRERYTEQEATEIAKSELGVDEVEKRSGYVYYGYGVDDNDISAGARNNWWLVDYKPKRGCPVWAFRAKEV